MSSAPQILANRLNAQRSTGPVTPEGKARVSQNATKLGLFSTSNFVRPDEQEMFDDFSRGYTAELSPDTPLEQTLTREIIHAAWRLRRCAIIESGIPEGADAEDLDRLQASIDRARTTAQRTLHRTLAELRRIQTERVYRQITLPAGFDMENLGQASCRQLDPAALVMNQLAAEQNTGDRQNSAEQSQSRPVRTASVARNALCPCRSGEKYKRCCGKTAPPLLGSRATGFQLARA